MCALWHFVLLLVTWKWFLLISLIRIFMLLVFGQLGPMFTGVEPWKCTVEKNEDDLRPNAIIEQLT